MTIIKAIAGALLGLFLTGCAGTHFNIGVGYHKTPVVNEPEKVLLKGVPPAVAEAIIKLLGTDQFAEIAKAALPKDEKVYLGAWIELEVEK